MAAIQPATFPPPEAMATSAGDPTAMDPNVAGAANGFGNAPPNNAAAAAAVYPYSPQDYYNYYYPTMDEAAMGAGATAQNPENRLFGWLEVPHFDLSDIFWTVLLAMYILPFYGLLIAPYIQWGLGYLRYLWRGDYEHTYSGPTYSNIFDAHNTTMSPTSSTMEDMTSTTTTTMIPPRVLENDELDLPVKDET